MFDYHAHIGKPKDNAYVCTSSLDEAVFLSPFRYRAAGLLPGREGNIEELEKYAAIGYGIGEIGLDRRFPEMEMQIANFKKGLMIAREYNSLVTVHSVGYTALTLSILRDLKPERFIFHSFTGSLETAREIERLGGYISLSPKARNIKHFVSLIHNTNFLIESDLPTGEEEERVVESFYLELCNMLDREIVFPSVL